MFKFFKNKSLNEKITPNFEVELTASVLAYEIARSDGNILDSELSVLLKEVKIIAKKVKKTEAEVMSLIKQFSSNSISFHEFINDINKEFSKEKKLNLISFLWEVAYADSILDVDEERLIRRIADLIRIKDIEVLKLKERARN
jgi:uncharacterized tellurite resistance protein B-like protein